MAKYELTVSKTKFKGMDVVELDYHNGGERPMYAIQNGSVDVEVFDLIQLAIKKDSEVHFEGFEKYKSQFLED
ncbi:hypothetical protein UT300009_30520 [Paraclostridium bifermentans]